MWLLVSRLEAVQSNGRLASFEFASESDLGLANYGRSGVCVGIAVDEVIVWRLSVRGALHLIAHSEAIESCCDDC